MAYQLLLSTDTLDQGRQKVNNFFTGSSSVWSSSTGTYSTMALNKENLAAGDYVFVFGYRNSGITGNFTVINGGSQNYIKSAFSLIGNGITNTINSTVSIYSTILNGKSNNISTVAAGDSHNLITGGFTNSIVRGKYNSVFNGRNNTINRSIYTSAIGKSNYIYGSNAGGIPHSFVNGLSNTISGSNGINFIFIHGYSNQVKDYSVGNTGYITMFGKSNNVLASGGVGATNTFMAGSFLNNRTVGNVARNNVVMFGKGTSVGSPLRPKYSYEMILGSSATRRARIRFDASPNAYLSAGSWQNSGADYGEYFEWADKNLQTVDRTGFFVEIINGKIQIAKSNNVVGIVSKTTSFIGDSHQDYWSEMYLKNEWGEIQKQIIEEYEFENNTKIYFSENNTCFSEYPNSSNPAGIISSNFNKAEGKLLRTFEIEKFNPNFDPSHVYEPRKNRSEWEVIGLLGKLRVRTSEPITSNFVDVDIATGMAKNGTKYQVLQQMKQYDGNYGIVLVFFK